MKNVNNEDEQEKVGYNCKKTYNAIKGEFQKKEKNKRKLQVEEGEI